MPDLLEDLGLWRPAINGQAERGFGHESMTTNGFEWRAGGIEFGFVIAGNDPDFPSLLDANLGGAEYVSRRMQRNADAIDVKRLSVFRGAYIRVCAEPGAENALTLSGSQIRPTAPARVVTVRVRDDGVLNGEPRVDVEIALLAVESTIGYAE